MKLADLPYINRAIQDRCIVEIQFPKSEEQYIASIRTECGYMGMIAEPRPTLDDALIALDEMIKRIGFYK